MNHEMHTIRDDADTIYRRFEAGGIDEEVREWAAAELRAIQTDLDLVLRGRDGFESFLLSYIQQERTKAQATDVDDIESDTLRDSALCTCPDPGCAIKNGRLPHVIRAADTLSQGRREFKQTHRGDPLVFDEAERQWSAKRGEVWEVLRRVLTRLDRNHVMPEDGDEPIRAEDADTTSGTASAD